MAASREDQLEAVKSLLGNIQDFDKNKKFDAAKLADFAAKLLSQLLSSPKILTAMQNTRQLPGSLGGIAASPMEIYKNIGERKSIQQTASFGGKALGVIASVPALFSLFEGMDQLSKGQYEKAQRSFEECAGVPGIVAIIENAISFAKGGAIKETELQESRDSLINVVTCGLPNTINLFLDLGYELTGNGYVPKSQRFQMDTSVLNEDPTKYWRMLKLLFR